MAEIYFRLILIGIGVCALLTAIVSLTRKKMSETFCLIWGALAFLFIVAGIFLHPGMWKRYLSRQGLTLIVLIGACVLIIAYFISVGVSDLLRKMRETAIQISLLNFENMLFKNKWHEKERHDLLIMIPVYNEELNIVNSLRRFEEAGIDKFADIIVVNDGSSDKTALEVRNADFPCVSGVFHQGYGSALHTGYKYASRENYSYVIQMDADGQHDICNVKALYEALQTEDASGQKPDIVLGSRFLPGSQSFPVSGVKMLAIRLFRMILRLTTGQKITDPTTGLQGLSAKTIAYYSQYNSFDTEYPDANTIMQMLLSGFRIQEIPAVMHQRHTGKSMHSGLKPFIYMFRMAFSMSAVYLRAKPWNKKRISGEKCVERNFEKEA